MEERKFIQIKKQEFGIKEYIKRDLGKGKISKLDIEYTPVGEKIVISTSKPGLVIGRGGEKIQELTQVLRKRFKLENPHIEILEIEKPLLDAQIVADEIAMALERMGNLKFKVIGYRKLQEIMNAGALGCELRLSGKLPSERARTWRFAEGYLKKAGEPSKEVDRAQATGLTKTGIIGIKVAIMGPDAKIYDQIKITDKLLQQIKSDPAPSGVPSEEGKQETKPKKKKKKKVEKKKGKTKQTKKEIEKEKQEIKEFDKEKEIKENVGDAMKIEEEIEEGVPQEQIDKDIAKTKSEEKNK
jgi:small subunit ribosomal protein S3